MLTVQCWTVHQMKDAFTTKYLPQCQTATERDCCTVFFRRELKDFVSATSRKLTPGECAILDEYGITY